MQTENNIVISLELHKFEAVALAQFAKRIRFAEIEQNAVDKSEAFQMRDAIYKLREALSHHGCSPD